jgi:hypothetical protein
MSPQLAALVDALRARKISEAIIERVIRLNPNFNPGCYARGLHLTGREKAEMFWMSGSIQKGEFIQRYGREAFASIPSDGLCKRGRRVYVTPIRRQARAGLLHVPLMGKRTRHITGKTHALRPRDFWPTIDRRCIPPLLWHLRDGVEYGEPLAGGGHLIILLNETSARCVYAADLKPSAYGVVEADALTATVPADAEVIITNPPWTRAILHKLIVALSDQKPTWAAVRC